MSEESLVETKFVHDIRVQMRDGVELSADLYIPRTGGPFPTILSRTPYESLREEFIDRALWWAERGFAVVFEDCRGRYESEGHFSGYQQEPEDGYDTIEWIASQPWSNGKIGMWGRSYGALVQWQTAPLNPEHLVCLAPHVIPDDYYHNYHYVGGAFQLALAISAAVLWSTSLNVIGPSSSRLFNNTELFSHLPLIDMDVEAIGHEIPYWREWLEHDTNDGYWRKLSPLERHTAMRVPTFQQGGWFDPYVESAFRMQRLLQEDGRKRSDPIEQRVLVGPWSHEETPDRFVGDVDFGPAAAISMRSEELLWFRRWLSGEPTIEDDRPYNIRIFVMGRNEWRDEQEWPLARTRFTDWYLHSRGRANSVYGDGWLDLDAPGDEQSDSYDYDPDYPVPTVGGVHSLHLMSKYAEVPIVAGPVDQRAIERRDDVAVYTSRALESDIEVTGPVELVLYAASSAPDTDFTAKLVDVWPDGRSLCVTEGIIRARYRNGDGAAEFLAPFEAYEYRLALYPTAHVFLRMHRLRLDLSSSNFPRFSRNLNTRDPIAWAKRVVVAEQQILHSKGCPSRVRLPIIPSS